MITRENYEENNKIYDETFSPKVGADGVDRMVLMVLLCNITQELRKTNPKTTVMQLIDKIAPEREQYILEWLLQISMHCEGWLINTTKEFPNFGLETVPQRVKKIKEIINDWMPF